MPIPMRVSIGDSPKRVDSRVGFGHFESDTVIGSGPSKRCTDTRVERKSRKLFARFVDDKSAARTAMAEYDIHKDIPPAARIDRTWDNGTESSPRPLADEAPGMPAYHADQRGSWRHGDDEDGNGGIRRCLPKRTGFEGIGGEEFQAIVQETDDARMKVLGYRTSNEVWQEGVRRLSSKTNGTEAGVALTN